MTCSKLPSRTLVVRSLQHVYLRVFIISTVASGDDSGEDSDGENERRDVDEDEDGEVSPESPVSSDVLHFDFC